MSRTVVTLEDGGRLTDRLTMHGLVQQIPTDAVAEVLTATGRASQRQRRLPAQVMVYYLIVLAFFPWASCREVLRVMLHEWQALLRGCGLGIPWKSAITQARQRLGPEPLQRLYERLVQPLAVQGAGATTVGAFYRQWRKVAIDGTEFVVADTPTNRTAFGCARNQYGESAYPRLRCVTLVELGTRVLFGARHGPSKRSEVALAKGVVTRLQPGMICFADRLYFSYHLWRRALRTGAALVWRVKGNRRLPVHQVLADGSYRSRLYASDYDQRRDRRGLDVRVIVYDLGHERVRLVTNLLDHTAAPAAELMHEYPDRWGIETSVGEVKTRLQGGAQAVLRSQSPALVIQEFYAHLLAHYAVRGVMHEAALAEKLDPDDLSFTHAAAVLRRAVPHLAASPPSGLAGPACRHRGRDSGRAGKLQPRPAQPARDQAPGTEVAC